MAKRNRAINQKLITKSSSDAWMQARGADYQPWLLIQDVPSLGLVSRIKGWKTKRVHHLLSNLELNYFYVLEWSPTVCDIREQYPLLPIEETIAIAQKCCIRHPLDPKTKQPVVMTTDFLLTVRQHIGVSEQARTIKPSQNLSSQRTLEKLEIERQYWQSKGIDWGIVTESEIPSVLAKNIEWLHPFQQTEDFLPLSELDISRIAKALTLMISKDNQPLFKIAADCDDALGLPPGTGLSVARYLIANRQWLVEMNRPIQPSEPLALLAVGNEKLQQVAGGA